MFPHRVETAEEGRAVSVPGFAGTDAAVLPSWARDAISSILHVRRQGEIRLERKAPFLAGSDGDNRHQA